MKLVPALFAGAAAVAAVAAQDQTSAEPTASPVPETTTKLVCEDGFKRIGRAERGNERCITETQWIARQKTWCDKSDIREWLDQVNLCRYTVDELESRCVSQGDNKQYVTFVKRKPDARKPKTFVNKKAETEWRRKITGVYKCMNKCQEGEQRLTHAKTCGVCAPTADHPDNPAQEVVWYKGAKHCKLACTGLSTREQGGKRKCVKDPDAKWDHPVAELLPETDGLPSALQELLVGTFSTMHAVAERKLRVNMPVRNPNPTVVRLAFHASMGKADACMNPDDSFNNGLQGVYKAYNSSYKLLQYVWDAFKRVNANDPDMCALTKKTRSCRTKVEKDADGNVVKGADKRPLRRVVSAYHLKNGNFAYNRWRNAMCKKVEAMLAEHDDIEQLWVDSNFDNKRVLNHLCQFVGSQLFPADISGPAMGAPDAYKIAMPTEKLMSKSDYMAFHFSEALQKSLPIQYNRDCLEVKDVLHKPKLDENGDLKEITCYDPSMNNGKEIQYLVKRYGRIDSDDCTAAPDGEALPNGSKNFGFNFNQMSDLFPGLTEVDLAVLLGAHTLGAFHSEKSGFDTATWVNCPGNLNVKFFELLRNRRWTPFKNTVKGTTSFRLVMTDEQCTALEADDGLTCTEKVNEQDGTTHRVKSRIIPKIDFDRELGALPVDVSLIYNFNSDNSDFFNNGLPLQNQDRMGNDLAIGRLDSRMTSDDDRSPAWDVIQTYVNHTSKLARAQGATQFILDFMPTYEKMLDNGYASGFSDDASLPSLQSKPDSNDLRNACMELYADRYKNAKHQLEGGEKMDNEKQRMQHCYHFDEAKLDDGDGFKDSDPLASDDDA